LKRSKTPINNKNETKTMKLVFDKEKLNPDDAAAGLARRTKAKDNFFIG
jgi:hypothetical protein